MGTKQNELERGCFSKAMEDEPMFVLLGRDPHAPDLVRKWAMNRRNEVDEGTRPKADMAQVNEAFDTATAMEEWRENAKEGWRNGLFAKP